MAQCSTGKLVSQIEIKSDGDVFHEIFRERPHYISEMSPHKIQKVNLHEGAWGKVGYVISWNYTDDGKEKVAKEIVEEIDEAKKLVKLKVIGGNLLELYKTLYFIIHVDTKGENNLVTWTFEYEKKNPNTPNSHTLMEFCFHLTNDIGAHNLR